MKRLSLVKTSPEIQLGYLYEHIFCAHIHTLMHQHHLFPRLDYSVDGTTYYGGIVYIDVELYTNATIALTDQIIPLDITLSEMTIFKATKQILAEKEEPFDSTGYDNVKQALQTLHAQPWQNMDNVDIIDAKKLHRRTGPFYIAEGKAQPARKLTTELFLTTEFAESHRDLLPLFRQIAWLIGASLHVAVTNTYGYFSLADRHRSGRERIGVINSFKISTADSSSVNLSDILDTCLQIIRNLQQYDAFDRYLAELRATSYYNTPGLAPDITTNYEDTLTIIGAAGWQRIATTANCKLLIENMSLQIAYGKNKVTRSISERIDN